MGTTATLHDKKLESIAVESLDICYFYQGHVQVKNFALC